MPAPSYSHGTSLTPAARRHHRRQPRAHGGPLRRPRGARRRQHGTRGSPTPSSTRRSTRVAARAARARRRAGRPGRHLGAELRRVGARAVRHREDRRDPRQRQPGLPHPRARATCCASRASRCSFGDVVQDERLRGDDRGGARRLPDALRARSARSVRRRGPRSTARSGARARRCAERMATLSFDDPINIQYTSGTTGFPEGRDALAPQHPQQRLLRQRAVRSTPSRTASAIPVPFYHCFGMVMGNLGATSRTAACMVIPAPGLRPARDARGRRRPSACTSLYGVPTMFIAQLEHPTTSPAFDLSSLRTGIMAGSPCPVEVMKRVVDRDAHGGGDDLLRHDRDLAGVHADASRRRRSSAACRRSARVHPHVEVKVVDPETRADRAARRAGRAVHPRLLR